MKRIQHIAARLAGRPLFWIAFVGLLFGAPLARGLRAGRPPRPPPVGPVLAPFTLRDDRGGELSSDSLRGHAFVANLLCAHCVIEGPLAAEQMRALQHRARNLGDALLLVSFSPDGDVAELAAIRARRPSSHRWTLLAGAPPPVRQLFHDGAGLLLIDAQQRIRGWYDAADLDLLLRDASLLLN